MGSDHDYLMELEDLLNLEDMEDMEKLISEDQPISPTGLQPEASNVPTLISSEPNNAKPAPRARKNYIRLDEGVIDDLRRRGFTLEQAANVLGVSKSTLKRKCRGQGISDWRSDREINGGTANTEIQPGYTMIVKAECEFTVIFSVNIYSNTRFETLHEELKDKLKDVLKTQSFLIEYEYGRDEWMMIPCTDDLKMLMDEEHPWEESQRIMVLRVRANHQ